VREVRLLHNLPRPPCQVRPSPATDYRRMLHASRHVGRREVGRQWREQQSLCDEKKRVEKLLVCVYVIDVYDV